jgi:hypothetical protein
VRLPASAAATSRSATVDVRQRRAAAAARRAALVKSHTPPTIDLSQFGALSKEAWSGAPEWATAMRNDFLHVIEQLQQQFKSDARGDETIAALAAAIAERDLALSYLRHSSGGAPSVVRARHAVRTCRRATRATKTTKDKESGSVDGGGQRRGERRGGSAAQDARSRLCGTQLCRAEANGVEHFDANGGGSRREEQVKTSV